MTSKPNARAQRPGRKRRSRKDFRPFPGMKAKSGEPRIELLMHELAVAQAVERAGPAGLALPDALPLSSAIRLALAGRVVITPGHPQRLQPAPEGANRP